jgi:hypothetical protein
MTPGDTIVKGLQAVAIHFDRSVRQVQRWSKEPDFPRLSGRRFDLLQIQAWIDRRDGQVTTRMPCAGDPRQPELTVESGKDFWDGQSKKYQAQLRELQLRQRKGELVERKEVEQLFVARIMAVKQGLLSLSRALPPQLVTCSHEREMAPLIDKAVRDLLEAFARPLPDTLGVGYEGLAAAEVADHP